MFFSRSTCGIDRQQTSTLGKCQVPTGISKKYIGMPSATKLFQEYVEKITSMRDKEPAEGISKRYGIGTSRLYKIWKNAQKTSYPAEEPAAFQPEPRIPFGRLSGKIDKCSKSRKICKNKSTYPHSARNTRKPLLGRGKPRRSGRSGQRGFTTLSKAPATPFWKTPK